MAENCNIMEEKWLRAASFERTAVYSERFAKMKTKIEAKELNGVILVPGANLRYLTGVNSMLMERPFLFFIPKNGEAQLVAPALESGPYLKVPLQIAVHAWNDAQGPSSALERAASRLNMNGKWGLEGRVPFRFVEAIMKHARPQLEDAEQIMEDIREIKEEGEIKPLKRAASILVKAFTEIPSMLKTGMTELELARKITQTIYSNGAESVEDILVQSGSFAADPHHLPVTRKLKRNEGIVVDASCAFSGYHADITRTFIMGKHRELHTVYDNVLTAQESAVRSSMGGATTGSIDEAARGCMRRERLDQYFIHRTGHGLGLEVHESPYIVPGGKDVVQAGMVFTIEPGVYFPGKLGVRIEDDVLASEDGCENLTSALPKEFDWWK
jgi:Xaa-Pro dipeptidase